jgi:hypothetical protein
MIKLIDLLTEHNKLNRLNATKFQVALEKFLIVLPENKHPEIILLANNFLNGVQIVNSLPFNQSTKYALQSELMFHVHLPAQSLRMVLVEHLEGKDADVALGASNLIKSLDEICYVN